MSEQGDSVDAVASGGVDDANYPAHWEADVVLRDGRTCRIRPVRSEDAQRLADFYGSLSEETRYTRFFTASEDLATRDKERVLQADHVEHIALVAVSADAVIGVATADSVGLAESEIAFIVSDDQQGRGLGSVLLEHLAAVARESGVHRFKAEVLSGNKRMLATFEAAGYTPTQELEDGIVRLDFEIDPTHKSRAVARGREHRAESLSIQRLLSPSTVAVMADDFADGSMGALLVENVVSGQFAGSLVAISPSGVSVGDVQGASRLADVGHVVDLVIMALDAHLVDAAVDQCADAGVRGIVLTTGGFIHDHDYSSQRELVSRIRLKGMRLVGPNALGLINTDPAIRLNASLVPEMPGRGRVGFFSQTGAFGTAILTEAARRGLGVSNFVSAGNRADVSGNDLLQYWEDDDATSLVLLYLESVGNPRKFTRIARRLARQKPVVAVRSGRSTQALPLGHAVRHTDLPADAIDAIFEQAGVMQVDSLTELLDLAGLLAFQPLPTGNRVGFVSDSDALGVLAMDASSSLGLEPVGPVRIADLAADAEGFARAVHETIADPGVDAVVVTHVPPLVGSDHQLAEVLPRLAQESTKPVLAVVLAGRNAPLVSEVSRYGMPSHGSVPVFADVEVALRALRSVVQYQAWLAAPRGSVPKWAGLERQRAHRVAVEAVAAAESADTHATNTLAADAIVEILDSYGIDVWPSIPVSSEEEAVAAAAEVGFPVVLKSTLERYLHRTDLGGVRLTLENEQSVRTAFLSMAATLPNDALDCLVVQRMAPAGVACVVATTEDPAFGPVVSFRLGGHFPRLLEDMAYRIPPLTDKDAHDLVRAPRSSPLLFNTTLPDLASNDTLDIPALEELIARVGQLADDVPELAALELNPIVVHPNGVAVLGAIGRVARPLARTDLEARRLL